MRCPGAVQREDPSRIRKSQQRSLPHRSKRRCIHIYIYDVKEVRSVCYVQVLETFQQTFAPVWRLEQKGGQQQSYQNTSSTATPTKVDLKPQRLPSSPFLVKYGGGNAAQPHPSPPQLIPPPISPPLLRHSADGSLKPFSGLQKEKVAASTITTTSPFQPSFAKDKDKNSLPHQQRPGSTSSSSAGAKQSRPPRTQALRKQGANGVRNSSAKVGCRPRIRVLTTPIINCYCLLFSDFRHPYLTFTDSKSLLC